MRSPLLHAAVVALLLAPAAAFAQTGPSPATSSSNPPGTVTSRAVDRAAGTDTSGAYPSQADGTVENPKGTMVSRAAHKASARGHQVARRHAQTLKDNSASRTLDRVAGTDNSGAYPSQADGMPGNPKGTIVSRALGTTNPK